MKNQIKIPSEAYIHEHITEEITGSIVECQRSIDYYNGAKWMQDEILKRNPLGEFEVEKKLVQVPPMTEQNKELERLRNEGERRFGSKKYNPRP